VTNSVLRLLPVEHTPEQQTVQGDHPPTRGNSNKEGPSHASTFTVVEALLVAFCHHGFNISCLCHALCCSGAYGMLRSFCTQGAEPGVREIFRLICSSN